MEYIRYYSTIILWASPFALSGIIRYYDGEFPSKTARTLFHPNNISYVGRMIIRHSNESGRSQTIDIYVRLDAVRRRYPLWQRFSTGGTRTTGGTPDVAKWYAKK